MARIQFENLNQQTLLRITRNDYWCASPRSECRAAGLQIQPRKIRSINVIMALKALILKKRLNVFLELNAAVRNTIRPENGTIG